MATSSRNQEEGIRVMTRSIDHEAVYALASGGEPGAHHVSRVSRQDPAGTGRKDTAPEVWEVPVSDQPASYGTIKRSQVAPEPYPGHLSEPEPSLRLIDPSSAQSSSLPIGGGESSDIIVAPDLTSSPAVAGERAEDISISDKQAKVISAATTSVPTAKMLPSIQRGLRASRIFPNDIVTGSRRGVAEYSRPVSNDRRRVHPEADHTSTTPAMARTILVSTNSDEVESMDMDAYRTRFRSPPPAVNLDFSPCLLLSEASSLPKLELDPGHNTPVSILPRIPHPTQGPSVGTGFDYDSTREGLDDGGHLHHNVDRKVGAVRECRGDNARAGMAGLQVEDGKNLPAEEDKVNEIGRADSGVRSVGGGYDDKVVEEEVTNALLDRDSTMRQSASIGGRQAEALRDRLNRTLSPQGVQVTAVMIRATELPLHIADQMSRRTLNVSLAAEQRAVKQASMQRVLQEEEIQSSLQQHAIEKTLEADEGRQRLQQVKHM